MTRNSTISLLDYIVERLETSIKIGNAIPMGAQEHLGADSIQELAQSGGTLRVFMLNPAVISLIERLAKRGKELFQGQLSSDEFLKLVRPEFEFYVSEVLPAISNLSGFGVATRRGLDDLKTMTEQVMKNLDSADQGLVVASLFHAVDSLRFCNPITSGGSSQNYLKANMGLVCMDPDFPDVIRDFSVSIYATHLVIEQGPDKSFPIGTEFAFLFGFPHQITAGNKLYRPWPKIRDTGELTTMRPHFSQMAEAYAAYRSQISEQGLAEIDACFSDMEVLVRGTIAGELPLNSTAPEMKQLMDVATRFTQLVYDDFEHKVIEYEERRREKNKCVTETLVASLGDRQGYQVNLDSFTNKLEAVRLVIKYLGLSLSEAKQRVESAPAVLGYTPNEEFANDLQRAFSGVGAKITVVWGAFG